MSTLLHIGSVFSLAKTDHIIQSIIKELCHEFGRNPDDYLRSNHCDYVGASVNYSDYNSPLEVFLRRQVDAFYQKNSAYDLGINTREVALATFLECEDHCRLVNNNVRARRVSTYYNPSLLHEVSRIIQDILGDPPTFDELADNCGFGPGANVGCTRFTSVREKINSRPSLTPNALPLLKLFQGVFPQWDMLHKAAITRTGKLAFVPKNAKTDRPICIEPMFNSFVQKGLGSIIRTRLLKSGIDLRKQTINQKLARMGSVTNSLATLDLKSASDTISLEIVREVLPPAWFKLLYAVRTPVVTHGNVTIPLEKFSSMGNGYTFELESLIFTAVTRAVCGKSATHHVYGDDIICPSKHASAMMDALHSMGFSVNSEKSFIDGPFRESCGGDFFNGFDVRPVYVKDLLCIRDLFRLHNFFKRKGMDGLAAHIVGYIPKRFRFYGPEGYGDGHLLSDHSTSGFFQTYIATPYTRKAKLRSDYLAFLYLGTTPEKQPLPGDVSPRDSVRVFTTDVHRLKDRWFTEPLRVSKALYFERDFNPTYELVRVYHIG